MSQASELTMPPPPPAPNVTPFLRPSRHRSGFSGVQLRMNRGPCPTTAAQGQGWLGGRRQNQLQFIPTGDLMETFIRERKCWFQMLNKTTQEFSWMAWLKFNPGFLPNVDRFCTARKSLSIWHSEASRDMMSTTFCHRAQWLPVRAQRILKTTGYFSSSQSSTEIWIFTQDKAVLSRKNTKFFYTRLELCSKW